MASFPSIAHGALSQYPYTEEDFFYTAESDTPSGKSYTQSFNATPLKSFVANFPCITLTEVQTLEDFFNSMRARLGTFSYTDEAATTWSVCRFDQDEFEVQCIGPNEYSVQLKIVALPS